MPTRSPSKRLNSLPQLNNQDESVISIKGNHAIRKTANSARITYRPPPASPTPRSEVSTPRQIRTPLPWRPSSSLRSLGAIDVPTVKDSTTDVISITKIHRNLYQNNEAEEIKQRVMQGARISPCSETRNAACSPMSRWSNMSEDLLEHVSQRVVLEQQRPPSARSGSRGSRPSSARLASARPTSVRSGSRPGSCRSVSRPFSGRPGSSYQRIPPNTAENKIAVTPGQKDKSARKRPKSSKPDIISNKVQVPTPQRSSYRDSLAETGIDLPSKTVDRLVESYEQSEASRLPSRPCSRMSDVNSVQSFDSNNSDNFYDAMRSKIYQGFTDMKNAFVVYDKIKSGYVNREDFANVIRHFSVDLNNYQILTLLKRCNLEADWAGNRIPYEAFLHKYLDRGKSGYIKQYLDPDYNFTERPQTGDSGLANLAETRIIAQLHADFVDVLESFRRHDNQDTGCVDYRDFRNVMASYGFHVPHYRDSDKVNYVDYLNSVTRVPPDFLPKTPIIVSRPQTAPVQMNLTTPHKFAEAERDTNIKFQSLSLNMETLHKDPRSVDFIKVDSCMLIDGGTRKPKQTQTPIQRQIAMKYGSNNADLRRIMSFHDKTKEGYIPIKAFRDILEDINIKVDENDFYSVVSEYDKGLKGVIPYKKILQNVQ